MLNDFDPVLLRVVCLVGVEHLLDVLVDYFGSHSVRPLHLARLTQVMRVLRLKLMLICNFLKLSRGILH